MTANTESAQQWGHDRPVTRGQSVRVNYSEAERLAISTGQKSEWVRAGEFRFQFGKHAGKTIHAVAQHDLSYLDWLLGEREKGSDSRLTESLKTYMADPRIQMALTITRRK